MSEKIEYTPEQQAHFNAVVSRTEKETEHRVRRELEIEQGIAKDYETQIEALKEQVEAHKSNYDTIMQASLESAISEFPEDTREMINNLPGDISEKFAWAKKYKEILDIKPGDGVGNRSTPPAKPDLPRSAYKPRGAR